MQHLIVRKLTRRELEDKYIKLIDDNYELKRDNNVQKEKIKVLTTKLLRLTKENSRYKSREFLYMDENEITYDFFKTILTAFKHEIIISEMDDFFRTQHQRPASSSVLPRKFSDDMRDSTPNLSRLKRYLNQLKFQFHFLLNQ